MKKTTRKTPQSVKTQRKIDAAVDVALKQQSQTYNLEHGAEIKRMKEAFKKINASQILPVLDVPVVQKKSLLPVRDPVHGFLTLPWQSGSSNGEQHWRVIKDNA
ncbi:hypothetical protein [Acinetobacter ursingii]|uniref:hypothetical protein n=1 Tax=Acinetobacter ursingii TaxID=108980 RepID=UPI0030094664